MEKERTLFLIKPDGLYHEKYILASLDNEGDRVAGRYYSKLPRDKVEKLYAEHEGKEFYPRLLKEMTNKPVSVHVYEGDGIIEKIRERLGPRDPSKARQDQIRSLSKDSLERAKEEKRSVKNIAHASTKEKAKFEIRIFFPDLVS